MNGFERRKFHSCSAFIKIGVAWKESCVLGGHNGYFYMPIEHTIYQQEYIEYIGVNSFNT